MAAAHAFCSMRQCVMAECGRVKFKPSCTFEQHPSRPCVWLSWRASARAGRGPPQGAGGSLGPLRGRGSRCCSQLGPECTSQRTYPCQLRRRPAVVMAVMAVVVACWQGGQQGQREPDGAGNIVGTHAAVQKLNGALWHADQPDGADRS